MENHDPSVETPSVHVFPPSIYPFLVCMAATLLMFGVIFRSTLPGVLVLTIGVLLLVGGVIGWMFEDTDLYEETAINGHG